MNYSGQLICLITKVGVACSPSLIEEIALNLTFFKTNRYKTNKILLYMMIVTITLNIFFLKIISKL